MGGSSVPKSAGSSIRRHNEEALQREINELLESWKGDIQESCLVFVHAPGTVNRASLFGSGVCVIVHSLLPGRLALSHVKLVKPLMSIVFSNVHALSPSSSVIPPPQINILPSPLNQIIASQPNHFSQISMPHHFRSSHAIFYRSRSSLARTREFAPFPSQHVVPP